jgi:hypothetical protein
VQNAGGVADTAGNFRPAGSIGMINAALPFAYLVGNVLHIDFLAPDIDVEMIASGDHLDVEQGATLTFAMASFDSVLVHGTSDDDVLHFTGPLAQPVTFAGGAGNDHLFVNAGTFTFDVDAPANCAALGINAAEGGNVVFNATQHLRDLNVDGTATLTAGGGKVIVTRSLSGAGRLDLGDNDLVLDYDPTDPPGILATLQQRIAFGMNGGTWDGSGIVTSMPDAQSGLTTLGIAEAADVFGLSGADTADFSGETVDATCVIIKYTYAGDANLDGFISGDDYSSIDFNVGTAATGYNNGDFNYDGIISGDDYSTIDFNFAAQGGPL